MKILQVVQNYYPSIGGTQILFQKLGEACVANYNDDIEVFTTDSYYGPDKLEYKKISPSNEVINGVKVYRFPFIKVHKKLFLFIQKVAVRIFKKRISFLNTYLSGPWSFSLHKAIANTNADVIVASSFGYSYVDYPLWRNKTKKPKPYVFQGAIHFNNDESIRVVSKRVLQSIQASEVYLANTEYEKQRLVKLSVDPKKIEVLGPSIDITKFENGNKTNYRDVLNVPGTDILLGYIGRIEPSKNIDFLLRALPAVCKEQDNVKLIIAGFKSAYFEQLKQQADALPGGIGNKILFLPDLSEQNKISLFNTIDILVLPSHNESFGIVFLEAWACKKPVIGVNIGAIACVINDKSDGLLVEKDNETDLAQKIIHLSRNKALRETLGNNGYLKTKELFTIEGVTSRYRAALTKAIDRFNKAQS